MKLFSKRRDIMAIDGVVAHGERTVRPGGKVKYANTYWQHEALLPLVGKFVRVHSGDYWMTDVTVSDADDYMEIICNIRRRDDRIASSPPCDLKETIIAEALK